MSDHYGWLRAEIATVKTGKFFVTSPTDERLAAACDGADGFPPSYLQFLREFGASRFFREDGCYAIGIFKQPLWSEHDDGVDCEVGFQDELSVCLDMSTTTADGERAIILRASNGRSRRVADSFAEYLRDAWSRRKARYSPRRWRSIVAGPPPFDDEELAIIEAARRFQWRVIAIDDDGTVHFEIVNGSDRRLAGIDVLVKAGRHEPGTSVTVGLAIKVHHIAPGAKAVVTHPGLRCLGVVLSEVEITALPDPCPEDRGRSEFGRLPSEDGTG